MHQSDQLVSSLLLVSDLLHLHLIIPSISVQSNQQTNNTMRVSARTLSQLLIACAYVSILPINTVTAAFVPSSFTPPGTTASTTSHSIRNGFQNRFPATVTTNNSNSNRYIHSSSSSSQLNYASSSLPDTSDPLIILNLEHLNSNQSNSNSNHLKSKSKSDIPLSEIKKAYRRMALKYHPDARTGTDATDEERQMANDDFAKINAAYAFLTGKSKDKLPITESEKRNKTVSRSKVNTSTSRRNTVNVGVRVNVNVDHGNHGDNDSYNDNGSGRSTSASAARTSSHHQRTASHHQRVQVNMRDHVQGFDINGNPRTVSTAGSATSNTSNPSSNSRSSNNASSPFGNAGPRVNVNVNNNASSTNDNVHVHAKAATDSQQRARARERARTNAASFNTNSNASSTSATKHDFYSSARVRARNMDTTTGTGTHARTHARTSASAAASGANKQKTHARVQWSSTGASNTVRNTGSSAGVAADVNDYVHVKVQPPRTKTRSSKSHSNASYNANANAAPFNRGENVKIVGGSYSGRWGQITSLYPTMVKVAISATMDVLVERKFVRHCTVEDMTDVGANANAKEGVGVTDDSSNSNDKGYSAGTRTNRSNPTAKSSSFTTPSVDGGGVTDDFNSNDVGYSARTRTSRSNPTARSSSSGTTSTSAGTGAACRSGSYSNAYSTTRASTSAKNWNWVDDVRGSGSTKSIPSPKQDHTTATGTVPSSVFTARQRAAAATSRKTYKSSYSDDNSGSYSWSPSFGTAQKKENIYSKVITNTLTDINADANTDLTKEVEINSEFNFKSNTEEINRIARFVESSKWLLIPGGLLALNVLNDLQILPPSMFHGVGVGFAHAFQIMDFVVEALVDTILPAVKNAVVHGFLSITKLF